MKARLTRDKYKSRLAKFLNYIGIEDNTKLLEDRARAFAEKSKSDFNWAFANILKFIQFQKERVNKKEITMWVVLLGRSASVAMVFRALLAKVKSSL
jgi:hypothetical protein